jgi:hypothetical protein
MEEPNLSVPSLPKLETKFEDFTIWSGLPDKVRENVQWLLAQSRFMYDDIDLEVRIGIC